MPTQSSWSLRSPFNIFNTGHAGHKSSVLASGNVVTETDWSPISQTMFTTDTRPLTSVDQGPFHKNRLTEIRSPCWLWFQTPWGSCDVIVKNHMMTSSNGNLERDTGPLCAEFTGPRWIPTQRPVKRSFDVFFNLRPKKRFSEQSWGWWFETQSCPLWRHCNDSCLIVSYCGFTRACCSGP